MLVSKNAKICGTPNTKYKICVTPNAKPQREPMEYRLRWVPNWNFCVGHVHFMLFVLISFALGNQRKPSLQWNMGLSFGTFLNFEMFILDLLPIGDYRYVLAHHNLVTLKLSR